MTPEPDRPSTALLGASILMATYLAVLVVAWWWNRG